MPSTAPRRGRRGAVAAGRAHRVKAGDGPPLGRGRPRPGVGAAGPGPSPRRRVPRGAAPLRLVQLLSAGAERFAGRVPDGVVLCNARGAHTPATAEWVVAAMLAAQRGLPPSSAEQAAGRWSFTTLSSLVRRARPPGRRRRHRPVGRPDARRLRVELTYVARTARDGVGRPPNCRLCCRTPTSWLLLVPVTEETMGMVDAAFLAAMPDGALLVNAARGVVVDTDALLSELPPGGCGRRGRHRSRAPAGGPSALVGAGPAADPARRWRDAGHQRARGRRRSPTSSARGARRRAAGQRGGSVLNTAARYDRGS